MSALIAEVVAESQYSNDDVQAVLFDMDGVLVDSINLEVKVFEDFLIEKGADISKLVPHASAGLTHKAMWKYFKEFFNLQEDVETLHDLQRHKYREALVSHGIRPRDESLTDFLDYLKSQNIKLALVTSNEPITTELILSGLGIKDYFEAIVTAEDVTRGKPFPEPYLRGAIALGVKPRNCLVIEDSKHGVHAAKDACMSVVAIRAHYSLTQDFTRADIVVENFKDIHFKNIIMSDEALIKDEL